MGRYCAPTVRRQIGHRHLEMLEPRLALSASPTILAMEVASTSWSGAFYDYLEINGLGQFGYTIPTGNLQQKPLPWSNLDRIYITFSEDVHVDANDLAVTGVNTSQYTIADFIYDPQLHTARWTLANSFSNDRILLDLDGGGVDPVTDLSGNELDGEWVNSNSAFPSGDGNAGGDFEFLIDALVGDVTRDGAISYSDYLQVYYARNKTTLTSGYKPLYDIDGSGVIAALDYNAVASHLGNCVVSTLPVGLLNDSPTSLAGSTVDLGNSAIDEAFSLHDLFDDNEDGASSLNYSLVSVSNESLFSSLVVDSGLGEIQLSTSSSGSGRSVLIVRATDSGGLYVDHTFIIDVNYSNNAPVISNYTVSADIDGSYWFEADISDADEGTAGWIVEFYGVHETRAVVAVDEKVRFRLAPSYLLLGWEHIRVRDSFEAEDLDVQWIGGT